MDTFVPLTTPTIDQSAPSRPQKTKYERVGGGGGGGERGEGEGREGGGGGERGGRGEGEGRGREGGGGGVGVTTMDSAFWGIYVTSPIVGVSTRGPIVLPLPTAMTRLTNNVKGGGVSEGDPLPNRACSEWVDMTQGVWPMMHRENSPGWIREEVECNL